MSHIRAPVQQVALFKFLDYFNTYRKSKHWLQSAESMNTGDAKAAEVR